MKTYAFLQFLRLIGLLVRKTIKIKMIQEIGKNIR